MSIISFGICALFFISTISALPVPSGVISTVIHNKKNVPIRCALRWETYPDGPILDKNMITIDSHQSKIANEKLLDDSGMNLQGFLRKIECGDLILVAPFEGVESIERLWEFNVESDKIVSVVRNTEMSEDQ